MAVVLLTLWHHSRSARMDSVRSFFVPKNWHRSLRITGIFSHPQQRQDSATSLKRLDPIPPRTELGIICWRGSRGSVRDKSQGRKRGWLHSDGRQVLWVSQSKAGWGIKRLCRVCECGVVLLPPVLKAHQVAVGYRISCSLHQLHD